MPGIEAVVFDLGGVLIDWDPRHLYRRFFADPAEMERFLSTVCTTEWHQAHDLGENTRESCLELAARFPQHADLIMAWADGTEEMVAGVFDDTVEVLREVKEAGVRCYTLSNMEPETFPLRRRRYGFMDWFDGHVISGIERLAKPDPRIFRLLLERYDLEPAATAFVDDRETNVAAAGRLGLRALLFRSAGALRLDLANLGLPLGISRCPPA